MRLFRRQFLHFAAGAVAVSAVSRVAWATPSGAKWHAQTVLRMIQRIAAAESQAGRISAALVIQPTAAA